MGPHYKAQTNKTFSHSSNTLNATERRKLYACVINRSPVNLTSLSTLCHRLGSIILVKMPIYMDALMTPIIFAISWSVSCNSLSHSFILFIVLASEHYGYNIDDIVMLTDDSKNPRQQPTKANIVYYMVLLKCVETSDKYLAWCDALVSSRCSS